MVNVDVLTAATTSYSYPDRDKWRSRLHGMRWNILSSSQVYLLRIRCPQNETLCLKTHKL